MIKKEGDEYKDVVGFNLKQFRLRRGMTQHEFAKAIGTSKSYLSRLESGHRGLGRKLMARIEKRLGKGPADFYAPRHQPKKLDGKDVDVEVQVTDESYLKELWVGTVVGVSLEFDPKPGGAFITFCRDEKLLYGKMFQLPPKTEIKVVKKIENPIAKVTWWGKHDYQMIE